MNENWSDHVTVYWDFTLGPITFLANLLLIIIIILYTPESTKTYSSIILTITISDCISLIGTFMTSARAIPRGSQLFLIFRGACIYCFPSDVQLKSNICIFFYALQIQFYILNHIILMGSYIYRMMVITNPLRQIDKRKNVYIILITYTSLHFCYFIWVWYECLQPMDVINREISKYLPDIVGSGATYSGVVDLRAPSQVVFNFLSIFSSSFVIIIVGFCKWRIYKFSKNYEYSEMVKKLHHSLDMIFTAQTIGPLLSFITSVLYVVINQMGVSTDTTILLENLMGRPAMLMYLVNPIVTFFFISPYRTALKKWFIVPAVNIVHYSSTTNAITF